MLYDTRWEKPEIKADPFSLDSLIAWLEKQPADGVYCYHDSGKCLLTSYFTAAGYKNVYVFVDGFWQGVEKIPGDVGQDEAVKMGRLTRFPAAFNYVAAHRDWTFGAALERARKCAFPS